MNNFTLILFIILFLGGLSLPALAQGYENSVDGDHRALMEIYHATKGENWFNNDGWGGPPETMGDWWGVATDSDGRVIHLDLQAGTKSPPRPGSTPNGYNAWGDPIGNNLNNAHKVNGEWILKEGHEVPESIGNLTKLKYLNLKHNTIRGPVPNGIKNLVNAERILLAGHPREPDYGSGNLAPSNQLTATGTQSSEGDSKSVQSLNYWEGSLPQDVNDWKQLEVIEIGFNGLTGSIPSNIFKLPELRMLMLHGNFLSGEIPSDIPKTSKLRYLFLSGNKLTGSIPPEIGNIWDLKYFFISSNQITGIIPPELGDINDLRTVLLGRNPYSPQPWPSFLYKGSGHNINLRALYLEDANLHGELPKSFPVQDYQDLNVWGIIDNPNFGGELPNWITQIPFIILDFKNNGFSGDLPPGFHDSNAPIYRELRNLYLFRNNFTGPLPNTEWSSNIRNILLYENNFTGGIPSIWGNIETAGRGTGLSIRLHRNNLSGEISPEIADMTMISPGKLLTFDISSNNFQDTDISNFENELLSKHPDVDFNKSNQTPVDDVSDDDTIAPSVPSPKTPSSGATNVSVNPNFSWSSVSADSYTLRVYSSSGSLVFENTESGTSYTTPSGRTLDHDTEYSWRVRASRDGLNSDWSSTRSFRTEVSDDNGGDDGGSGGSGGGGNDPLTSPDLTSPKDGETGVSLTPTLQWENLDADYYILHLDTPTTESLVVNAEVNGTSYSVKNNESLNPDTLYKWRVRGVKDGVEGEWSSIAEFITQSDSGGNGNNGRGPQKSTPAKDEKRVKKSATFTWESIEGAESYTIEVRESSTSSLFVGEEVTDTVYVTNKELRGNTEYVWRVRATVEGQPSEWSDEWEFTTEDENSENAFVVELDQNYPNPFNPSTNIRFTLSETQEVSLKVYDMAGRLVASLVDGSTLTAGTHSASFNAQSLASGIYFYRLITPGEIVTRKMTLMK